MKSALKNRENPDNDKIADTVATEILKYADRFDQTEMQTIETGFRLIDPEVVSHFKKTIQSVQDRLSWTMVAKLLHLGVRLLRNITPESHSVHSQQWNLLMVFLEFLQEELSSWVDKQGGWVSYCTMSLQSFHMFTKTSMLYQHNFISMNKISTETSAIKLLCISYYRMPFCTSGPRESHYTVPAYPISIPINHIH